MEISVIVNQLLILFSMILLGYILFKTGIMSVSFNKQLSRFILNVTTPAMILSSVMDEETTLSTKTVMITFVVAIAMYLILPLLAKLITFIVRAPKQQAGIYDFVGIYGNIGFMGFPLISAILGPNALLLTAIFNIIFNFSAYSVGILIITKGSGRDEKMSFEKLRSPGIILSVLAVIVYLLHISFPQTIITVTTNVGSLTPPLAMMMIGSTLATMPVKEMITEKRMYLFLVLRQILVPLLCWPVMKLLIHDTLLLTVTFIMLIVPVGNTSVLFATNYDLDTKLAAKAVFITTLFCVATIPLMLIICHV